MALHKVPLLNLRALGIRSVVEWSRTGFPRPWRGLGWSRKAGFEQVGRPLLLSHAKKKKRLRLCDFFVISEYNIWWIVCLGETFVSFSLHKLDWFFRLLCSQSMAQICGIRDGGFFGSPMAGAARPSGVRCKWLWTSGVNEFCGLRPRHLPGTHYHEQAGHGSFLPDFDLTSQLELDCQNLELPMQDVFHLKESRITPSILEF